MFKIGDFSKLTRVSVRMLRYYDEVGLFKPVEIDDFTGYRYYSAKQISELNLIISLRDMGFNVADIEVFMKEQSHSILVPGDYSNIAPAYNFLGSWIEENGYSMAGNPRQVTIKGSWNEKGTEDYLSEIQIPVKNLI